MTAGGEHAMRDQPEFETLALRISGKVADLQLARPASANAMDRTLWRELGAAFRWLDGAPGVRAVVLSGQGKHFCAGMDLQVFAELGAGEPARSAEPLRALILQFQASLTAIEQCRKPVLAAIHGACLGGGLAMAACCDARYAAAGSRFSIREIDLGMTADVGTLQRLPHLMPRGLVHELAYTGRDMDAEEALRCGLVNQLCEDAGAVHRQALEIAAAIARKAPSAVRGTKHILLHGRDHSIADGLNYVATWNAGMIDMQDVMTALSGGRDQPAEFDD